MDIEYLREYCLRKNAVEESFPFGDSVLVFKTGGKIFLLLSLDHSPPSFNVKCDPEKAVILREAHPAIVPGFHMNKKHWNTVILDGSLSESLIREMVDDSYNLIAGGRSGKTGRGRA